MSKSSKAASKLKRLAAKRARKASNRAHYQELARTGQNSKSRRALNSNRKRKRPNIYGHPAINCGNVGCKRCFPRLAA